MKSYSYRGYKFRMTNTLCANNGRYLYEIDGLKERGKRPFITTIRECRDFIDREGKHED